MFCWGSDVGRTYTGQLQRSRPQEIEPHRPGFIGKILVTKKSRLRRGDAPTVMSIGSANGTAIPVVPRFLRASILKRGHNKWVALARQ